MSTTVSEKKMARGGERRGERQGMKEMYKAIFFTSENNTKKSN